VLGCAIVFCHRGRQSSGKVDLHPGDANFSESTKPSHATTPAPLHRRVRSLMPILSVCNRVCSSVTSSGSNRGLSRALRESYLIAAWAAVVVRGLEQTALAARKGRKWERAYLVGLGVGCAFGVGVVLSIKNSLPLDTFALGFLLAAGAGFAIWAFGRRGQPGKRKAVRSKRQTEQTVEDGLGLRPTE
jgi:hypothetical protein